jgi:hypothetical protein
MLNTLRPRTDRNSPDPGAAALTLFEPASRCYYSRVLNRHVWILALIVIGGCKRDHASFDRSTLPALLDRYQAAMQQVAGAVANGTCSQRAAALAPVIAAQRPLFDDMAALYRDPLREEFSKLVDARGEPISTPEVAFKQARFDCKDDREFTAVLASMPR